METAVGRRLTRFEKEPRSSVRERRETMAVITIARQIGSGGGWIAARVAQQLDYQCIDRRLVEEIAELADTTPEEVEQYDEKGEGLDLEQARELVEQHDHWRQQYLRNYHKADWEDPLLYHLTINTGKIGLEEAVDLIAHHAVHKLNREEHVRSSWIRPN